MKTFRHRRFHTLFFSLLSALICTPILFAAEAPRANADSPATVAPKKLASEDRLILNFHRLGEIANRSNIVRCANPVGDIADRMKSLEPTASEREQAKVRMQHLYDQGIRAVVSLQRQEPPTETDKNLEYAAVALEKAAAQEVGLTYVAYSMSNKGKNSLQDMSDADTFKLVESIGNDIVKRSETGGVAFHCKSGKDRTGLIAGYLRIKYQGWTADQAILEMRENGHVWQKFLKPGNSYSWHEEHLRSIAKMLPAPR